jgi:hypothetical protein
LLKSNPPVIAQAKHLLHATNDRSNQSGKEGVPLVLTLRRPPKPAKSLIVIFMAVIATMTMMTLGVWLWAIIFTQMLIFNSLEEAVYYSLVAYTTLGLGDVAVPHEQRLLGGMTAANGFLMFGLMTAMLTDTLRHIRRVQHNLRD